MSRSDRGFTQLGILPCSHQPPADRVNHIYIFIFCAAFKRCTLETANLDLVSSVRSMPNTHDVSIVYVLAYRFVTENVT